MLLGVALWLTAGAPQTAPSPVTPEPPRLVFLSLPGVGGGGGGSGAKQKKPAARLERASGLKASVSAPPAVLTRTDSNTATEPPSTPATAGSNPGREGAGTATFAGGRGADCRDGIPNQGTE